TVALRRSLAPTGDLRADCDAALFRLRRLPGMRWTAPLRLPAAVPGLLEPARRVRSISATQSAPARVRLPSRIRSLLRLSRNRSCASTHQWYACYGLRLDAGRADHL